MRDIWKRRTWRKATKDLLLCCDPAKPPTVASKDSKRIKTKMNLRSSVENNPKRTEDHSDVESAPPSSPIKGFIAAATTASDVAQTCSKGSYELDSSNYDTLLCLDDVDNLNFVSGGGDQHQ